MSANSVASFFLERSVTILHSSLLVT